MNALILVDIQKDFLPGGPLGVPAGHEVIPVVNRLMPGFEHVVATQDWHPPNHESFAANHPGRKPGEVVDLHGIDQILWPAHCVQESEGAEIAPGLAHDMIEKVFRKGADPEVDSYSGFFDNGRRRPTGLERYLRENDVREVYLTGLATDYCVKFTALDARSLGFSTTLIEDATRGIDLDPGDVVRAIEEMRKAGVRVVRSDLLFDEWHPQPS